MFPTKSPYSPEERKLIINTLNQRVANLSVLYSQAKNAHWNSKGFLFYELHLLFDRIAGELLEHIDVLAERLTSMGGVVNGNVHQAATNSSIPMQLNSIEALDFAEDLLNNIVIEYEAVKYSTVLVLDAKDNCTANLLSEEERTLGTHVYLLESSLLRKVSD